LSGGRHLLGFVKADENVKTPRCSQLQSQHAEVTPSTIPRSACQAAEVAGHCRTPQFHALHEGTGFRLSVDFRDIKKISSRGDIKFISQLHAVEKSIITKNSHGI
jgi:hypothetical protein